MLVVLAIHVREIGQTLDCSWLRDKNFRAEDCAIVRAEPFNRRDC